MSEHFAQSDEFTALLLIDDDRVSKMRLVIPPAAFRGIIHSYLGSAFFAALENAGAEPDDVLAGLLHDCKGTSANIGALRLRAMAEALELACHAGDRAALLALLPAFHRVAGLTRAALASLVA